MKVCGSQQPDASGRARWRAPPARGSRVSGASVTLSSRASASTHQKPALWRVASYSGPGLPRPTNSLIMVGRYGEVPCAAIVTRGQEKGPPKRAVVRSGCEGLTSSWRRALAAARPWRRRPWRRPWRRGLGASASAARRGGFGCGGGSAASSRGRSVTTDTSTGFGLPCVTAFTPLGSLMSFRCSDMPFFRPDRSTSMNSGRSAGRQEMSSSVITWLTRQCSSLTASDSSAPM